MTHRRSIRDDEITALWDLLIANPAGVTRRQIADTLRIGMRRADDVIHAFRLIFGNDDTINLVFHRDGRGPCIYTLKGTRLGIQDWTNERRIDTTTRLETLLAVLASIERSTDGRTIDGRIIRIARRTIERAIEDLADLAI